MASDRIQRFTLTERVLHWSFAAAFLVMLTTGLIIYFPSWAEAVGRRTLLRDIHLLAAIAWVVAIVGVIVFGNRRALARTWAQVQTIDADDRRRLRLHPAPAGRFNVGQKLNTIVTAAFAVLFLVSGFFLWLGERDKRFRFDGTGALHDILTYISIPLLIGHLYLALIHPSTRHALRGMTRGDVDTDWARRHHPRWVSDTQSQPTDDDVDANPNGASRHSG